MTNRARIVVFTIIILACRLGIAQDDFVFSYDNGGNMTQRHLSVSLGQRVRFDSPTKDSLVDQIEKALHVYPNPTRDILVIEGQLPKMDSNPKLILFDQGGRTISEQTYNGNNNTISVNGLPPGVYFLDCRVEDKAKVTYKIIKSN